MNEYYDRYGTLLEIGDAVAALKGSEEEGYTAATFVVWPPSGHHTPMLKQCYSFADIYIYIPTDKDELERRKLTSLGPHRGIDYSKFCQWRREVQQLPDVDCKQVKNMKPMTQGSYGRYYH